MLVNGGGCFHFGAGSKAKPMSDDGGCEKRGGALFVVPQTLACCACPATSGGTFTVLQDYGEINQVCL